MPDTVVGLFRTRSEAEAALGKLKDLEFSPEQIALATPRTGRRGHYGIKVAAGIVVGTLLGAFIGALVAGMVPGVHPLFHGAMLATFALAAITGAITGGIAGSLFSMAASGDKALYYEQEVEAGRFLVSARGPRLEEAREVMLQMGAMESAPLQAPMDTGRPRPESG